MDPWSEEDLALDRAAAERDSALRTKRGTAVAPKRIRLPKKRVPPHRDELARSVATMRELAAYVGEIRAGLGISQTRLAARAGVSRQWLVALASSSASAAATAFRPCSARKAPLCRPLRPALRWAPSSMPTPRRAGLIFTPPSR